MKVDLPIITVITVCYNAINSISETVRSVLNQSYFSNIEYIVIDGNSTDGTLDVLNSNLSGIDKLISEPDLGIYDAMNKGILNASGDWILFLNAGDKFFGDDTLQNIYEQLLECDVLYGKTAIQNRDSKRRIRDSYPRSIDWKVIPYCHQSVLIKRDILAKSLFNTSYKIAADYDQYFRLKNNNIKFESVTNIISVYDNEGFSALNYKSLLKEYKEISLLNHPGVFKKLLIFLYFSIKIYL